jgi:hypothetical protein
VLSGQGSHRRAIALAREAVDIFATTDHLNSQGDAMVDLALVLAAAGSEEEAASALAAAIERFTAKGNIVSAREAGVDQSRLVGV